MKLLLFLLAAVLIVSGCTSQKTTWDHADNLKDFEIPPSQLDQKMKEGGFKLLDVREDWEYKESHLKGTLLLSVDNLTKENLDSLGLKKNDEIIVYCRSGKRSERAYNTLKQLGYENVKSLNGGIIHWEEEGFELVRGDKAPMKSVSLKLDRKEHDFGQVAQFGGTVSTTFTLTNSGAESVTINKITTSCACTTATSSKKTIPPGEEATLTVVFDPDLHEEPKDRFKRTIFIDIGTEEVEATIWVDILEGV